MSDQLNLKEMRSEDEAVVFQLFSAVRAQELSLEDWDAASRNGFEPKAACASAIAEQRQGLGQLIAQIRTSGDDIRRQRAANGLPNR